MLLFDVRKAQPGLKYTIKSKGVIMSHDNGAIIHSHTYESMLGQATLCLETHEDEVHCSTHVEDPSEPYLQGIPVLGHDHRDGMEECTACSP
jgi:hypothetical protein